MDNNKSQILKDDSEVAYQVTIPITIPSIGDYSIEGLKQELTAIAIKLINKKEQSKVSSTQYSSKLQHLRSLSRNTITAQDIKEDERLAYLISK